MLQQKPSAVSVRYPLASLQKPSVKSWGEAEEVKSTRLKKQMEKRTWERKKKVFILLRRVVKPGAFAGQTAVPCDRE